MKQIPLEDRPRERLLRHGAELLGVPELIAILLGTGTKGKPVLQLAQELFAHFGGLSGLLDASVPELMQVKGIGRAKAIQLKAAFGIALKGLRPAAPEKKVIAKAEDAYRLIKDELDGQKQETLMVVLLDVKKRLIHREKVSIGTLSEVLVHPREVFYPAVRHKAHSLIIAHNHPSGDPTPSKADLELTRVLLQSSRVMGIALDDHLIIGSDSFVSIRQLGLINS